MILTAGMTATHRTLQASRAEWLAVRDRIAALPHGRISAPYRDALLARIDAALAGPDSLAIRLTVTTFEASVVLKDGAS